MAGGGDKLRILICSEETSDAAVETLKVLAKTFLRQLESKLDERRLDLNPPGPSQRPILTANKWKSTSGADYTAKVSLRQLVATELVSGFVIFHFDGDEPYQERKRSQVRSVFEKEIVRPVRELLRKPLRGAERTDSEVDSLITKLLVFQPFYSIEAWLFYNTKLLRTLCKPQEQPTVEQWHTDPTLIEELHKPKEHLTCGAKHNQQLATSQFPTRVALDTKKSFADTLTELSRCEPLVERLRSLAYPSSTSPAPAPLDSDDD